MFSVSCARLSSFGQLNKPRLKQVSNKKNGMLKVDGQKYINKSAEDESGKSNNIKTERRFVSFSTSARLAQQVRQGVWR